MKQAQALNGQKWEWLVYLVLYMNQKPDIARNIKAGTHTIKEPGVRMKEVSLFQKN